MSSAHSSGSVGRPPEWLCGWSSYVRMCESVGARLEAAGPASGGVSRAIPGAVDVQMGYQLPERGGIHPPILMVLRSSE